MQDIHYNNKIYMLPDNWNELLGKQIIAINGVLHCINATPEIAELKVLKILLNMGSVKFGFLSNDAKARMLPYIQWVANNEILLTENILPSYKKNIFCKKMYGPSSDFDNLLMGEFHFAEVAYRGLIETNDIDYLNELVAILYRPAKPNYNHQKNKDGDVRTEFADAEIAYHKTIVSKWSMAVKQAILQWYCGCREMLVADYPLVYDGKQGEQNSNYYAGLYNLIRSIAGEKYGTIDKVEQLSVHTAHLELTCIIEDANRLEEAYKKQN